MKNYRYFIATLMLAIAGAFQASAQVTETLIHASATAHSATTPQAFSATWVAWATLCKAAGL